MSALDGAAVAKEETFAPLAPLFRFKDEAEVIAMSNDTEFGLDSDFHARDLPRALRAAQALTSSHTTRRHEGLGLKP